MNDDDDLRGTAIFDRLAGTLLEVEREAGTFQHRGAGDLILQLFQLGFFHSSPRALTRSLLFDSRPTQSGQDPKAAKSKAGKGAARN
jgi:hypothetical protein